MKFLIVLALALTVSSAAFTGSLVRQTQPVLNQIKADLSLNIKARSSADVGLQSAFIDAIQEHVSGVIGQIESAVAGLQSVALHVAGQIQEAVQQIQAAVQGSSFVQSVQTILGNLFGLFGGKSRGSFAISAQLSAIIQAIIAHPHVNGIIHGSELYNCINDNLAPVGGLNFAFLQALNAQGNLSPEYLLASPFVAPCIADQGGVVSIIQNSAIIAQLQGLVAQLGLQDAVHGAILHVLGEQLGGQLIALLGQNNRGLFDNLITGAGNLWETISGHASSFASLIANVASQVWASAAEKLALIKQIAQAFIAGGVEAAQQLGQAAAQQLIDTIVPYYNDLGVLAQNVIAELHSIYADLNIPESILNLLN